MYRPKGKKLLLLFVNIYLYKVVSTNILSEYSKITLCPSVSSEFSSNFINGVSISLHICVPVI